MKNPRKGFTIVELLIVIVVIAILAAISVVAYAGIRDRASASSMAAVAGAYAKAYKLYKIDHNDFPGNTCLGTIADYPADPPFQAGECSVETDAAGTPRATHFSLDDSTTTQLSQYTDGIELPELETVIEDYGSDMYYARGLWLTRNSYDVVVAYALPGNRQCADNGSSATRSYVEYTNVTYCYLTTSRP